jgi:hypothetical protein
MTADFVAELATRAVAAAFEEVVTNDAPRAGLAGAVGG